MIKLTGTGILYRNPNAHVRSVHAYFPSVAPLDNGELLATVVLAEAFEAVDSNTHVLRSIDNGETWAIENPVCPPTRHLTSNAGRITPLPGARAVALIKRADRSAHPDEGLSNPLTQGFVPVEFLLSRTEDAGHTWSRPRAIRPALVGPSFELCCPVTPLSDGRWLLPTSTWSDWEGNWPSGKRMVALISNDEGRTWPGYTDVMTDPRQRTRFWESKIVELADGRLLAVAWAYDETAGRDRPNQYAVSRDGGVTWTRPRSTGLRGQTLTPFVLSDGRILCVYRRMDIPGLWANVSRLEKGRWVNESEAPLWGAGAAGLTAGTKNMAENFKVLRFGAPCVCRLQDGTIYVAFWGYEDCVSNIRWIKLRVS